MKRSAFRRSLVLLGVLSTGALFQAFAGGTPQPKSTARQTEARDSAGLPTPDYLPELARDLLRKKMERHGKDAKDLMFGVTLLQYDLARTAAQSISAEPRLVRPTTESSDTELNRLLPERFFVLQDEARKQAQSVAAAAERRDTQALAQSYGRLMETCISCHAAYLHR
jgi:cytochrome c556